MLGIRAKGLKVVEAGPVYQLREPQVSYLIDFGLENDAIGAKTLISEMFIYRYQYDVRNRCAVVLMCIIKSG